ncbi:hypothetical protein OQA88_543 [Cercophora sp. LCS_1]
MAHHEPFKSLSPLAWSTILSEPPADLLRETFGNAQLLVDSIPSPDSPTKTGRPRSETDSAALSSGHTRDKGPSSHRDRANTDPAITATLRKEWKPVKISAKENTLGIDVYKLAAKDGKGSWFARRSVHAVDFDKMVLGLKREFAETSSVLSSGGGETKSVRGLGAEKRVERMAVEGVGVIEVYLVSVRFPGPTTPRDFVTVISQREGGREREFMLVSRPCLHEGCEARNGFIRGTYESVELVRERRRVSGRRTRSSVDLGREVVDAIKGRSSVSFDGIEDAREEDREMETEVEWLMVTRSDPGGSVPRFMVEKGTPGGIVSDAARFLKWLESKSVKELEEAEDAGVGDLGQPDEVRIAEGAEVAGTVKADRRQQNASESTVRAPVKHQVDGHRDDEVLAPSGFYGMIAGALEAAGSIVVSRMSSLASSTRTDSSLDEENDTSSELDYASAEEFGEDSLVASATKDIKNNQSLPDLTSSARSAHSTMTDESVPTGTAPSITSATNAIDKQHGKELRRLQEKQRRANEKMIKNQERLARKRGDSKDSIELQETALAKLREKHEREKAKQEEKHQKELKRLEEKREAERRKAEERKRKAVEREEKQNLQMELEKARAERDVALREIEILKGQVGALQSQNTMLVARLGKE